MGLRKWLRAHRERIEENERIVEQLDETAAQVDAQWAKVHAHSAYARRQVAINHVGQAVTAMIDRRTR